MNERKQQGGLQGWKRTTLGEALPIHYGKARNDRYGTVRVNAPVYGSSGRIDTFNRALTRGPSLIIGRKGNVGAAYYSPEPCWPIDTVYFAEASEEEDLRFFKYLLDHLQLVRMDRSTAVPGLSRDDYNVTEVFVPDLEQQRLVVAEIEKQFSRLDEAVANLKRVKANLKRYKAAVLKAAVEGKLTGDWRKQHPNVEPASKLLERILAERREKWHQKRKYKVPAMSSIGNPTAFPAAPEGWTFVSMEQLLPPMREAMKTGPFGSLLKKHEHKAEGVAVLGIENIEAMRFVRGSKIHITQKKAEDLTDYKVVPDDVLISRSGTVGEVCVVPEDIGEARISTNLMKVSLARDGMLPKFFILLFNGSPFVLNQVSDLCKGSTRSFLNQEILKQLCFVLPPLPEQREIIAEVERRLSVIEELEAAVQANLTRADRLRQSILQKAFIGELSRGLRNPLKQVP